VSELSFVRQHLPSEFISCSLSASTNKSLFQPVNVNSHA
jgi:hypothetical protein